jgi:hypothetical protein
VRAASAATDASGRADAMCWNSSPASAGVNRSSASRISAQVHQSLAFLVEHRPAGVGVVLASRSDANHDQPLRQALIEPVGQARPRHQVRPRCGHVQLGSQQDIALRRGRRS